MEKRIFSKQNITAAIAAIALMGCQGSDPLKRESNPHKGFTSFEEAVPAHDQKPRPQAYVGDLFVVNVDNGQDNTLFFNFSEGVAKSYKVNFRMLVENVTYTTKLELSEEAQKLGISWNSNGTLSWTPPVKTIPATRGSVSFDGKIVLVPSTTDSKAQKLLTNKQLATKIKLVVSRQEAEPKIVRVEGINEKTVHYSAKPTAFRITVSDPAMGEQRDPVVHFADSVGKLTSEQINEKGYVSSVNSFFRGKAVKAGANGTWTINYTFEPSAFLRDAEMNNVDLSKLPDVITVVTTVTVVSYGQTSPETSLVIKIKNPKAKTETPKQGAKS